MEGIMLEFLGDNNEWTWFSVSINTTPKEALLEYLKERGFEGEELKITEEKDGFYSEHGEARAYTFTIEDGAKK